MAKHIRENLDEIYKFVLTIINSKLENNGYSLIRDDHNIEGVETRLFQWSNTKDNHAIQILWDGKDNCFGLGEFDSLTDLSVINSKDIVVISFQITKIFNRKKYRRQIINNLVEALNEKLSVTLNIKKDESQLTNIIEPNSILTFERKQLKLSSRNRTYIDFNINGKSLAILIGGVGDSISKFGWGSNMKFELSEFEDFKSENQSRLDNALFSLYVCNECGDEGCGALMFKIIRKNNLIIWCNFIWGDGNIDTVDNPDDKINIDPIVFSKTEYENSLTVLKKLITEDNTNHIT